MMTLHYASGSVLMATDVCEALLDYAAALAAIQGSDVLTVPVVSERGETAMAELVLGPASQLMATFADGREELGRDQGVIDDIARRTQLIRPRAAISGEPAGDARREDAELSFDHDRS